MDSLSPELLDAIIGHVDGQKLAPLATLSHTWQYQVERRTFAKLTVRSPDLDFFIAAVVGSRRRALRQLSFHVVLPTFADPDNDEDRQRNNTAFTQHVHALFRTLATWDLGSDPSPVSLSIEAYSINKHGLRRHVWERRLRYPTIELATTDGLDSVPLITKLEPGGGYSVHVPGSSIASIASRLPNLSSISAHFREDREMLDIALRRQNRHRLATALQTVPTEHLVDFSVHIPSFCPDNELRPAPNVLGQDAIDHLSLALHRLLRAPNLTSFGIHDGTTISPGLFRPIEDEHFPNLEHVQIDFTRCAPDGEWYFDGDPTDVAHSSDEEEEEGERDSDDYDPEHFSSRAEQVAKLACGAAPIRPYRCKAVPERVRPLFVAAAEAAQRMPRLRAFGLRTRLEVEEEDVGECSVNYAAPGVECMLDRDFIETMEADRQKPRCYTCVPGMEEDAEIRDAWVRVREGCLIRETISG